MTLANFSLLLIFFSMVIYRSLLLLLPFYAHSVSAYPLLNIVSGTASDLVILMPFVLLWIASQRALPSRLTKVLQYGYFGVALLIMASFAAHLRYVEHFGMSARLFHIASMDTPGMWSVGLFMVFESWRVILFLSLAVGLSLALLKPLSRLNRVVGQMSLARGLGCVVVIASLGAACNGVMLMTRFKPGTHAELRYNPVTALYYNFQDFSAQKRLPIPVAEDYRRLRQEFLRSTKRQSLIYPREEQYGSRSDNRRRRSGSGCRVQVC